MTTNEPPFDWRAHMTHGPDAATCPVCATEPPSDSPSWAASKPEMVALFRDLLDDSPNQGDQE
jgi:hypothetical protein